MQFACKRPKWQKTFNLTCIFVMKAIGIPQKNQHDVIDIHHKTNPHFFSDGWHWHSSQKQLDVIDIHHIKPTPDFFFVTDVVGIPHKISMTSLTFITKPNPHFFCDGCHCHSSQNQNDVIAIHHKISLRFFL